MLAHLLLVLSLLAGAHAGWTHGHKPVCIVGAGFSGVSAAARLNAKGYKDVIVFEKSAEPGGKATNWKDPNNVTLFMGAALGTVPGYPISVELLKRFNVEYETRPLRRFLFNYETGARVSPASPSPSQLAATREAYDRYVAIRAQYSKYLVPGYVNGVPDEVAVPVFEFLVNNNLQILAPGFWVGLTVFGYGSWTETPIIYAFKFLDASVFAYALGLSPAFLVDYNLLLNRMIASIPARFLYGVDIYDVHRKTGHVEVKYRQGGKNQVQWCSRLILAIPQRSDLLAPFNLDEKETDVFDRVITVQYFSATVNMYNSINLPTQTTQANLLQLTGGSLAVGPPKGDGQPLAIWDQQANLSNYQMAYSWKSDDGTLTLCDVKDILLEVGSKLNRPEGEGVQAAQPLTRRDIGIAYAWTYFPHFRTTAIKEGIFNKLEALQGHRGTYYTSSLRGFENIESVIESAYDIVDRYF